MRSLNWLNNLLPKKVGLWLRRTLVFLTSRDTMPIVGAVGVVIALQFILFAPSIWALWIILGLLVAILSGSILTNFTTPVPGWWHTLFSPSLLVVSTASLILFLDTGFTRQLTIFTAALLLALFWENVRRYYWDLKNYHAESLENVSLAINIFIVWYTSSTLFHVMLDPSLLSQYAGFILPLAAATMVAVVYSVDYRTIWVQRYDSERVWLLLVAQALIVSEIFWLLNFLPHSIQVKSFVVAMSYYLFISLGRSHLDGTLTQKVLKRYIYLALGLLGVVMLTARWLV